MTDRQALEKLIKAWEVLPEGMHHTDTIARWLKEDMAPAINNAREVLKDEC